MQRNPNLGMDLVLFSWSLISVIISKLGFFCLFVFLGFFGCVGGAVQRAACMFQFKFDVTGCLVSLFMLFCSAG